MPNILYQCFIRKGLFVLVFCSFLAPNLFAQVAGDFRSVGSGNWTNPLIWQTYNGTTWVAATNYPGALAGTNDVYIQGGYTVDLGSAVPNAINSLLIGDGVGGTDTFQISNNATLNTPLVEIRTGGFMVWTNNVSLFLPSGAQFRIAGGVLDDGKPCSAAKRLVIGSQIYSTCNGGAGVDYSFEDLQNEGGSLAANPSSNSPICVGTTLTLFANATGAGSSGASYSWVGTGPGTYSFSSTAQDPTETGLAAGTYTYTVTVTDGGGYSYSASTEVVVNSGVTITSQPASQQVSPGSNALFSITASGVLSYQWQVSTDGGTNYSNISNGVEYSGTQTSDLTVLAADQAKDGYIYRVRMTASGGSCPVTFSNPATLTVQAGMIISNRRVTYRVIN
ncbi:PKD domain-containing protein [Robiginitalea sp. IMCC43444]|uniref:PKD domain-containing protein n=1 Tax=Robiginitalea sp. IMCC43444 TaxID=3459121 RepID=UPI004041376A